jgi:hypothetical protein
MSTKEEEEQKQRKQKKPSKGAESGPMAMGMSMARKMVSQMVQGGSPMEMMAQMSEGGKSPSMDKMMGMCMGMCSEMLNAIHQTCPRRLRHPSCGRHSPIGSLQLRRKR